MDTPSFRPQCPNHAEPLEGIGFPMPRKGVGTCPISGCPFDFEVEVDETNEQVDKFGVPTKVLGWKVDGSE